MNRYINDAIETLEERLNSVAMTEDGDIKKAEKLMALYLRVLDTTNDFRIYSDICDRVETLYNEYPSTIELTLDYDLE